MENSTPPRVRLGRRQRRLIARAAVGAVVETTRFGARQVFAGADRYRPADLDRLIDAGLVERGALIRGIAHEIVATPAGVDAIGPLPSLSDPHLGHLPSFEPTVSPSGWVGLRITCSCGWVESVEESRLGLIYARHVVDRTT